MIVVDASVLAVALGDDGTDGRRARDRLTDETLAAPELVDLEVVSVWRRHVAAKLMTARRATAAVSDLEELPLRRSSHRPLLRRVWELRHAVTPYDAAYIASHEPEVSDATSRRSREPMTASSRSGALLELPAYERQCR